MIAFRIYGRLDNIKVRFVIHASSLNNALKAARIHPSYRGVLAIAAVQIS